MYTARAAVISKIPGFWLGVFLNHPVLKDVVCIPRDEAALQHVTQIVVSNVDDLSYRVEFEFAEGNPVPVCKVSARF